MGRCDSLGGQETRLTTKKNGGKVGSGGGAQLRIKSSHEKVLEPGGKHPKTKATRGAARAVTPRVTTPRSAATDRGRNLRKARAERELGEVDRDGAWSAATESARVRATAI